MSFENTSPGESPRHLRASDGPRTRLPLLACLLLLPLGAGCDILLMTSADEVVRSRVAGVRATPAEIGLGESTVLDALLVHTQGEPPGLGAVWFACLESGNARGCLGADFGSFLGGDAADDDDSAAADFDPRDLQFGVGDTFTYTAEGRFIEDAWADLDPVDRVEGLSVLISVNYVERSNDDLQQMILDLAAASQAGDQDTLDRIGEEFADLLGDGINAARRVVVSDKSADEPDPITCDVQELLPNANPTLDGLVLHTSEDGLDEGYPVGAVTFAAPGETLTLRPSIDPTSREDYLYIDLDEVTQCRRETPYFSWMSNGGDLAGGSSFIADPEDLDELADRPKSKSFEMPVEKDFQLPVDLWIVMRDRRGGVAFGHWTFQMAEATGP